MNNKYDTIIEALSDLNLKGYNQSFSLTPQGLYCPLKKIFFKPDDVTINEFHRFEGDTDMSDMAILYALETANGSKGIIIDAYGTYSDSDLGDFLKQTKFKKE